MNEFKNCDRGGVAVVFCIIVAFLFGFAGFVLDLGKIYDVRSKADESMDAAVLAAGREAVANITSDDQQWKSNAESVGGKVFEKNFSSGQGLSNIAHNIEIKRAGSDIEVTGRYNFDYHTSFINLIGIKSLSIGNTIVAGNVSPSYVDIHLLVDLSGSMGIGATAADQTILTNATGCAIACHVTFPWDSSNYVAARASGAKLRVDVVRDAIINMIKDIQSRGYDPDQVRISIDGFSNTLIPITAPSLDYNAILAAANSIDLVNAYSVGTNIYEAVDSLAKKYAADGAGASPADRKSYVVVVSDGVENSMSPVGSPAAASYTDAVTDPNFKPAVYGFDFNWFQRMQAMDTGSCQTAKSAGHTVLTGHIEYLIPTNSPLGLQADFDRINADVTPHAIEAFTACASEPALSFRAVDSAEIEPMFNAIFAKILKPRAVVLTK